MIDTLTIRNSDFGMTANPSKSARERPSAMIHPRYSLRAAMRLANLYDLQLRDPPRFLVQLGVIEPSLGDEGRFGEPSARHVPALHRNPPVAGIAADDLDRRAFREIRREIVEDELADLHAGVGLLGLSLQDPHSYLPLVGAAGVVNAAALSGEPRVLGDQNAVGITFRCADGDAEAVGIDVDSLKHGPVVGTGAGGALRRRVLPRIPSRQQDPAVERRA